jgi:hydrogenase maturation protease
VRCGNFGLLVSIGALARKEVFVTSEPRILIAGMGNVFLGDDGFGVEVVQRLSKRYLPDNVCVVDFGIRASDLTHALLHGYEAAIIIETVKRGCASGTVSVVEPPRKTTAATEPSDFVDSMRLLRLVAALGGELEEIFVVGCEPSPVLGDAIERQMSLAVRRAVVDAIPIVEALVIRLLHGRQLHSNIADNTSSVGHFGQ